MAGMAWHTTHVAGTYKMPVPINAIQTFQQPLVGQKQKDQTCSLVKNTMHCIVQTQTDIINRTSQHEHVHVHVTEIHKNAFPCNAQKNLPTTSGWTKTERPKPCVGHKSMPKHVTKT